MSRLHMRGLNTSIRESRFQSQAWLQKWKSKLAGLHWCKSGLFSIMAVTDGHITAMMLIGCRWPQCGGTPVPVHGCTQSPWISQSQLVLGQVSLGQAASCQDFLWIPQRSAISVTQRHSSAWFGTRPPWCPTLFEQWCYLHTSLQAGKPP